MGELFSVLRTQAGQGKDLWPTQTWPGSQSRLESCTVESRLRRDQLAPSPSGKGRASTSVIREEPPLQQMLTKPLCCGGAWLSGPQMIMEMGTGEIRAIAPELWPECSGGYVQVAQTGLQRTLVSQQLVLKS